MVKGRNDWCKPAENTKDRAKWVSKVDWRSADKVDPSYLDRSGFQLEALDDEIKDGLEHDALMAKARSKLELLDRINVAS